MIKKGVLYIVFGEDYIREAIISAESVKMYNRDLHVTLMCDMVIESEFIDDYKMIKAEHIRAKVDYIHQTPYAETIFLDSDTVINHDIAEMFDILEKFDFAIAHDYARKRKYVAEMIPEYAEIPYMFSEVNPGVIVFRNNKEVQNFFSSWRELFYRYKEKMPWEQPTFRVAFWQSEMKSYIMPPEYNIRSIACRKKAEINHDKFGEDHLRVRIYHMHANSEISKGKFEFITVEESLEECRKNAVPN